MFGYPLIVIVCILTWYSVSEKMKKGHEKIQASDMFTSGNLHSSLASCCTKLITGEEEQFTDRVLPLLRLYVPALVG